MEEKRFLNASDISMLMDVSMSKAYKIIKELNNELRKSGYIVVSGRVSKAYFEQKVYCFSSLV